MCAPTNKALPPSRTTSTVPPRTPRISNSQDSVSTPTIRTPSFEVEVSEVKEAVEVDGIKVVGIKVIVGTVESEVGFEEQPMGEQVQEQPEEEIDTEESPKEEEEDDDMEEAAESDDDDDTVVAGASSSSSTTSNVSTTIIITPSKSEADTPTSREDNNASPLSFAEQSLVDADYADAMMPTGLCLALERRRQLWKRGFLLIAAAQRYGDIEAKKRTKRVDLIFDELRVNNTRLRMEHGNRFRSRFLAPSSSNGGRGRSSSSAVGSNRSSSSSPSSSSLYYLSNKVFGLTDRLCQ